MVEKTDRPKKASRRSPAGKTAKPAAKRTAKKRVQKTAAAAAKLEKTTARKSVAKKPTAKKPTAKKPMTKKPMTKKPAAKKNRKRAAKPATEGLAVAKEELASRRIAGGQDIEAAASNAPENQHPIPPQASPQDPPQAQVPAGVDGGTVTAPGATPGAAPETLPSGPAPTEGQPEAAGRVPESGKWGKTDPRTRTGESAEGGPRPNTLVPTNGIHTTKRRLKRKLHQNRGVMALVAATLLGIIVLGEQTTAPDMTEFEREIAAVQTSDADSGSPVANSPPGIVGAKLLDESMAIPGPEARKVSERQDKNLNDGELVEMERLLARLDLGPSTADGIVDNQTKAAIRLYQKIAGLPINGAPSRSLLADIREVVKILEDGS